MFQQAWNDRYARLIEGDVSTKGLDKIDRGLAFQNRNPVKVLTSGMERRVAVPFEASGKVRHEERVPWWGDYADPQYVVFGHYAAYPGEPHGQGRVVCIDYGVTKRHRERLEPGFDGTFKGKLAAFRFPERLEPCLQEIRRTFCLLGDLPSSFQASTLLDILDRVAARHSGMSRLIADTWIGLLEEGRSRANAIERLAGALVKNGITAWRNWQEEDWADLQSVVQGIIGCNANVAAWFLIGDHLGETVFQLMDDKLTVPLARQKWDYLYAGVDRLPEPIRLRVENAFPRRYRNANHLILQLVATFEQLCDLLAEEDRRVPYWDRNGGKLWFGSILVKQFTKPAQNQRIALDAYQRSGWKEKTRNPFLVGHTNLDRAIDTCKQTVDGLNDHHETPGIIHFGHSGNGDYMTWQLIS